MKKYLLHCLFLSVVVVATGCNNNDALASNNLITSNNTLTNSLQSTANPHTNQSNTAQPTNNLTNTPKGQFARLTLQKIIQNKGASGDVRTQNDTAINSPKSATFTPDGKKLYIQSLEGYQTVVFNAKTLQKIGVIDHKFDDNNAHLFKDNESSVFGYAYAQNRQNPNHFWGKPVEATLSHNGRYLWVSYYRRSFDKHAQSPSAVAIIDTTTDKIVRVMPSAPLPKMLATSPDNRYVAVTHWGDNTVGLIDITSNNPMDFQYVAHITIDYKLAMNFGDNINRDSHCGNCLRGTVFTPDSQKLLVGKMGGNGIAVIDVASLQYLGTITGSLPNIRHLAINNNKLIISTNKSGAVQSASLDDIFAKPFKNHVIHYPNWQSVHVGAGVRTIDVSGDGRYIFAAVNDAANVSVIDAHGMKVIGVYDAAKFPVGMALSPDENQLVITSQGKAGVVGAGNTVSVFAVNYHNNHNPNNNQSPNTNQ